MKWAVTPDGRRVHAEPDGRGTCPACVAPVFAKCGDQVEWHWAHAVGEGADCELGEGLDADEYTGWHIAVQTHAAGEGAVIEATHPTKKRRADIRTSSGLVIELQHSRIDPEVVRGREADWLPEGPMCWLWDAAKWDGAVGSHFGQTPLTSLPAKPLVVGRTPILLDYGVHVLHVTAIAERPHLGLYDVITAPTGHNVYGIVSLLIQGNNPPTWLQPPVLMGQHVLNPPSPFRARSWQPPPDPVVVGGYNDPPAAPTAPKYHVRETHPFCAAPSFDGTFSGAKCGLTPTRGSIYCWAHIEAFAQDQEAV